MTRPSLHRPLRERSRRRQLGAAAVFVAISLVASVAALALALDLGRLYFTHRDLQKLADMAALDAARAAGGCLGEVRDAQGSAAGEAAASLQRNGGQLSYLTAGRVEIGRQMVNGGVRGFLPDDSTRADSVRVTLRRPLPGRLIPLFSGTPHALMTASAAATLRPIVSFDVASTLANANPTVSLPLLNRMLGNPNASVLGPGGALSGNVSLGDLRAAVNAGSVEDFLNTRISAPAFLAAISQALSGTTDTATRATLDTLAAGADASRTVVPRDVLGVPAGPTADGALVNVGALVTSLAQAANGQNLVNLDNLGVNIPGIASASVSLRLIELARPAVGPPLSDAFGNPQTFAQTAQGVMQFKLGLAPVLGTPVKLSVYLQAADASGALAGLDCAQRGRPQPDVRIDARTGIGNFGVGHFVDIGTSDLRSLPVPAPVVDTTVAGVPVRITASASAELQSRDARQLDFSGPYPSGPQSLGTAPAEALARVIEDTASTIRINVCTGPAASTSCEQSSLDVLNPALELAIAPLRDALRPAVADALRRLGDRLIQPALDAAGITLGGARVAVNSVSAQQPEIFAR